MGEDHVCMQLVCWSRWHEGGYHSVSEWMNRPGQGTHSTVQPLNHLPTTQPPNHSTTCRLTIIDVAGGRLGTGLCSRTGTDTNFTKCWIPNVTNGTCDEVSTCGLRASCHTAFLAWCASAFKGGLLKLTPKGGLLKLTPACGTCVGTYHPSACTLQMSGAACGQYGADTSFDQPVACCTRLLYLLKDVGTVGKQQASALI